MVFTLADLVLDVNEHESIVFTDEQATQKSLDGVQVYDGKVVAPDRVKPLEAVQTA